jgi:hypothetical protein
MSELARQLPVGYIDGFGNELVCVHLPSACKGRPCVIHNPSSHALSHAPTLWSDRTKSMYRVCEHGTLHPDPDQINYVRRTYGDQIADRAYQHECCGCCHMEGRVVEAGPRQLPAPD